MEHKIYVIQLEFQTKRTENGWVPQVLFSIVLNSPLTTIQGRPLTETFIGDSPLT